MVRAFLAIDLPESLKRELSQLSKEISLPKGRLKWVEEENFHITLKFLGNIRENQIKKIEKICQNVAKDFRQFELVLGSLGAFPEKGRPRVLWVGLEGGLDMLKELVETLQRYLLESKIISDLEEYHPHITLLRIREIEDEGELREFVNRLAKGLEALRGLRVPVEEVILYKSELSSKGPKYTPLLKVGLAK